jgi:hypothetical protein
MKMIDAMDVLQEAFDGILSEMSDKQVLELASLTYVDHPFTCPVCGSSDISAGPVHTNDGAVWSDIECLNPMCRAEWQEDMEIVACDFSVQGSLPDNWRELWLKQREGE